MKIYTASFFEPEYHGKGRKIAICPSKPKTLQEEFGYDCDLKYEGLSPEDIYWDYLKNKKAANGNEELSKKAGQNFASNYMNRLEQFKLEVEKISKETGDNILDIIGLQDEDTLLSWERGGNLTFRTHTADFLRSLGYEVEER